MDKEQEDWIDRTTAFFEAIQNPLTLDIAQIKGDITTIDKEIVYLKSTDKLFLESLDTGLGSYDFCFGSEKLVEGPMNSRLDSLHPSLLDPTSLEKVIKTINLSASYDRSNPKKVCVDKTNAYLQG